MADFASRVCASCQPWFHDGVSHDDHVHCVCELHGHRWEAYSQESLHHSLSSHLPSTDYGPLFDTERSLHCGRKGGHCQTSGKVIFCYEKGAGLYIPLIKVTVIYGYKCFH